MFIVIYEGNDAGSGKLYEEEIEEIFFIQTRLQDFEARKRLISLRNWFNDLQLYTVAEFLGVPPISKQPTKVGV